MLAVVVASAVLFARVGAANVFVADRRMQDDGTRPPVRSVGVLHRTATSAGGTAFLFSACHVATAYHVAFASLQSVGTDAAPSRSTGDTLEFMIGPDPRAPSRFATSTHAHIVAFGQFSAKDFRGMAGDWAILRLDDCLGKKYGYLRYPRRAATGPMPSGPLMTIGYPASRSGQVRLTVERGCKARDHGPVADLIGVDCAFENGMSGGPVLEQQSDGSWLVVGLVQQSMGSVDGVLPEYSIEHRNQMLSVEAFRKALDEAFRADVKRLLAERPRSLPATGARRP